MKFTYDLVIIGGTTQSIFAAEYAVKLGARVALIVNNNDFKINENNSLSCQYKDDFLILNSDITFEEFVTEKSLLFHQKYLPNLKLLGVDIIYDNGYFNNEKKLSFQLEKYHLYSNSYLLAMTANELFLKDTLKTNNFITINQFLLQNNWHTLPENIIIIGDDISTIYLVNKLINLGKSISLIIHNKHILPTEDEDISFQLQLILESQGVKISIQDNVDNIDQNNNIDHTMIIYTKNIFLQEDKLKLNNLGINSHKGKILVNDKLQTQHGQIYACGDLLGGYNLETLTYYEAKIAVNNSLLFPWQEINYFHIPYILKTNPSIYRVGYTEKNAKLLSGKSINILIINFISNVNLKHNCIFIKIILDHNNYILGFHGLGLELEEILTTMTLLITKNKPLNYIFKLNFSQVVSWEIVKHIKQAYKDKNNRQNNIIMNLLETFFIWKRV